ncbi:MAG: Rdx family protein [Candidatus Obscuribacterales bacterium]|nr:Rdx family protein [Candidatus Obscuribacterales bacterium]
MAAELENRCSLASELIVSSGGVFEIEIDGTLIFSKAKLGRFPEDGEVIQLLKA